MPEEKKIPLRLLSEFYSFLFPLVQIVSLFAHLYKCSMPGVRKYLPGEAIDAHHPDDLFISLDVHRLVPVKRSHFVGHFNTGVIRIQIALCNLGSFIGADRHVCGNIRNLGSVAAVRAIHHAT